MKAEELHEQALKIIEPYFLKKQEEAMAQYSETRSLHLHSEPEPGDEKRGDE